MAKSAAAKKAPAEPTGDDLKSRRDNVLPKDTQFCNVFDVGATTGKRTHVIEGVKYALSAFDDEPCQVPLKHAVLFLKDKQFAVFTADGHRMRPQTTVSDPRGAKLAPHETIATFAELTKEALVRRANALPNGLLMNMNTTRDKLIGFIMAGGMQAHVEEETDKGKDRLDVEMEEDGDQSFADKVLNQSPPGLQIGESVDADLTDLGD